MCTHSHCQIRTRHPQTCPELQRKLSAKQLNEKWEMRRTEHDYKEQTSDAWIVQMHIKTLIKCIYYDFFIYFIFCFNVCETLSMCHEDISGSPVMWEQKANTFFPGHAFIQQSSSAKELLVIISYHTDTPMKTRRCGVTHHTVSTSKQKRKTCQFS